jgi:tRNA threonylcarbamoyladenosine biosynthesis protein TsaE
MADRGATTASITTRSPDTTRNLGAALGLAIAASPTDLPLLIALNGELGAGKTTFVGGLLRALGIKGAVRSPTYTLIEPYDLVGAHARLYHLDLYRLANASELEMLAPRDLLDPGAVLLVEWADRSGRALPQPDLTLTFRYPQEPAIGIEDATVRLIEIEAGTSTGRMLAASLHQVPNEPPLSL